MGWMRIVDRASMQIRDRIEWNMHLSKRFHLFMSFKLAVRHPEIFLMARR